MNSFKKFLFAVGILGIGYAVTASASSLGVSAATHIVAAKGDKTGNKGKGGHHHHHKGGKGGAKKSGK